MSIPIESSTGLPYGLDDDWGYEVCPDCGQRLDRRHEIAGCYRPSHHWLGTSTDTGSSLERVIKA